MGGGGAGSGGATGGAKAGSGGATGGSGLLGTGGAGGKAGTGGAGGGKAGAGGNDGLCGGGSVCTDVQYCDWQSNQCGGGVLATGACKARPDVCPAVVDRVCACDGQIHSSPCAAAAVGQDIDESGSGCKPPAGTFACGPRFCTQGTQYCEAMIGGAVGLPGSYGCHMLPVACGATPTCACLVGTAQCGNCVMSADGDLTTRCLFPSPL